MLSLRRDDVTTTRTVVRITNFNPRLREGGDHPNTAPEATTENFNPRLREGGDAFYRRNPCIACISIHASAKEATIKGTIQEAEDLDFNPRLREGGDCDN